MHPVDSLARPVAFPDGWMLMEMHDAYSTGGEVTYSPTVNDAFGYRAEYYPDKEWQFHGAVWNHLIHRWNMKTSQANAYLLSGAGMATSDMGRHSRDYDPAAYTGVEVDWESRRFFTLYSNRVTYAGDIEKEFYQTARVGVAPYLGDFGDLHTWLMLQADHRPGYDKAYAITPLIRMFKGNYLWEAGISNHGDVLFNFTTQF